MTNTNLNIALGSKKQEYIDKTDALAKWLAEQGVDVSNKRRSGDASTAKIWRYAIDALYEQMLADTPLIG